MLTTNTMRYASDEFAFNKSAMLTPKTAWDMSNVKSIDGFTVDYSCPDTANIGIIFSIDDSYYTVKENGDLEAYTGTVGAEEIALNGNTPLELSNVTSIPAMMGKSITPIIALLSEPEYATLPEIKLGIKYTINGNIYVKEGTSQKYDINGIINDYTLDTHTEGNATIDVVAILDDGSPVPITNIIGKTATSIKFKYTAKVNTITGADVAEFGKVSVTYTQAGYKVSSGIAELCLQTEDFENELSYCTVNVKHSKLIDSQIKAFTCFKSKNSKRERISVGEGNGTVNSYTLGVDGVPDENIDHNSLIVYADGERVLDFGYNTLTSTLTLVAKNGSNITASYTYNNDVENWVEMDKDFTELYTINKAEYLTKLSVSNDLPDKTMAVTKVVLIRPEGSVENQLLGKGTGKRQDFVLPHKAKAETITCSCNFSYNEESQIITVIAEKNADVIVSYQWLGESQSVTGLSAGWAG